jgi:MFS family permease
MSKKARRFYYGWVITAVSFFTLFLTVGIRYSFGVFYVAILKEYSWSRGETAGAFSLAMVMHSLFALVTGTLIDRVGPRLLFPLGATFLAVGLVAASHITTVWHLYLFFGVIIAVSVNSVSYAPHMSLIPKWFIRKVGLASGIVSAGIGLGTMAMAPFIQLIIEAAGWRSAFLVLAAITLGVVVPMTAILQRRTPAEVGQHPDGIIPDAGNQSAPRTERSQKHTQPHAIAKNWSLRAAMGTSALWWMVVVNFFVGFHINMLLVHQAAHVVDLGYSGLLAASLVGLVGLFSSVGGVFFGTLSDRIGREAALSLGGIAAFVGMLIFLLVHDAASKWMLYAFVILYGLGYGATSPICAAAAGDLFPGGSLGRILGLLTIAFGLGGASGSYIGGFFYDRLGSYTLAFVLLLASIVLGTLAIWKAAPRRRRFLSA